MKMFTKFSPLLLLLGDMNISNMLPLYDLVKSPSNCTSFFYHQELCYRYIPLILTNTLSSFLFLIAISKPI